jgi:6-phosphogluconolactonase
MQVIRTADAAAAAARAADEIAAACREAVSVRGAALIAVSGGETPWRMLEELCARDLPWDRVHVAQVDERIAPRGDPRRNLARLEQILVVAGPLPRANLLAMPVDDADPAQAAGDYQHLLESHGGKPLQLDLVHLGLGSDGHTASLVPGDPVLEVHDRDVAVTNEYQGLRRMTLTLPALGRARRRLWLVSGAAKAARLQQLLAGAADIPAVQVPRDAALVICDAAAATG